MLKFEQSPGRYILTRLAPYDEPIDIVFRCSDYVTFFLLPVKRETEEFRLLRDLFKDYDKEVRPVYNTTDVVNVNFSLSLIQIISVVS